MYEEHLVRDALLLDQPVQGFDRVRYLRPVDAAEVHARDLARPLVVLGVYSQVDVRVLQKGAQGFDLVRHGAPAWLHVEEQERPVLLCERRVFFDLLLR